MIAMVRKAIHIIQTECHEIIVEHKTAHNGVDDDLATNGDKEAQKMYIEEIQRDFHGFGIIAEEANLRVACTLDGDTAYFTLDQLDGTKAYERKQSHGVGTMLALIVKNEIVAAYVGDVNTSEIYGYCSVGIDADKEEDTIRYRFGRAVQLTPELEKGLKEQYLLLRDTPHTFPYAEKRITLPIAYGGLFKNLEISGGSIGTHIARLWKGEVGGVVLNPGYKTPWDVAPVIGITLRLGFKFFKINPVTGELEEYVPTPNTEIFHNPYYELVIHEKHVPELKAWFVQAKHK